MNHQGGVELAARLHCPRDQSDQLALQMNLRPRLRSVQATGCNLLPIDLLKLWETAVEVFPNRVMAFRLATTSAASAARLELISSCLLGAKSCLTYPNGFRCLIDARPAWNFIHTCDWCKRRHWNCVDQAIQPAAPCPTPPGRCRPPLCGSPPRRCPSLFWGPDLLAKSLWLLCR